MLRISDQGSTAGTSAKLSGVIAIVVRIFRAYLNTYFGARIPIVDNSSASPNARTDAISAYRISVSCALGRNDAFMVGLVCVGKISTSLGTPGTEL